jgi:hypothetical protein
MKIVIVAVLVVISSAAQAVTGPTQQRPAPQAASR